MRRKEIGLKKHIKFRYRFNFIKEFYYKYKRLTYYYHYLVGRYWHKYHLINVLGEKGYKGGWIDRCSLVTLACFKILKDFVEEEDPEVGRRTIQDYGFKGDEPLKELEGIRIQLDSDKEIRAIYDWWTIERPAEELSLENLLNDIPDLDFKFIPIKGSTNSRIGFGKGFKSKDYKDYKKRQEELEKKEEEMLFRLLKIRDRLWT